MEGHNTIKILSGNQHHAEENLGAAAFGVAEINNESRTSQQSYRSLQDIYYIDTNESHNFSSQFHHPSFCKNTNADVSKVFIEAGSCVSNIHCEPKIPKESSIQDEMYLSLCNDSYDGYLCPSTNSKYPIATTNKTRNNEEDNGYMNMKFRTVLANIEYRGPPLPGEEEIVETEYEEIAYGDEANLQTGW